MAILTWRNVDAPNFSGALEGYRTASQLLNNAVTSGKDAVGAYTQANSDAADRAIMNRALGLQTAEAHQAALASGALVGPDGQNASMKLLGDMDTRPTALLNRDVVRENLGQTQYTNQRGRERDASMDAASPDAAKALLLARNNDQEGLNKLFQSSPTLQKLRSDQLATLLTGVDTFSTSFQGRRTSDVNFGQGQWRFGNEVRDSNDAQTAQAAWLEIQRDNATPDTVQGAVNARAGTMSPGAMARLNNLAKGGGYNINGPVGVATPTAGVSSSGSGGGGGDSFAGSIPFAETRNYVSKITGNAGDLSGLTNDQKLEKLVPLVLNQESGNRRYDAQGKLIQGPVTSSGERAQGEMQVMPATSRDPGYGVKPAKDNSPDEVARVGRDYLSAMLNKYNGNVDQALAAYNAGPGAVDGWLKNKDPAAALIEDARRRDGMNLGVDLTRQEMRDRAGQNQAVGIFPELDALQADRRRAVDIVDTLVGKDKPLRDSSRAEVLDYINWIVENGKGRITPAMAGEMLARNVGGADNLAERAGSMFLDVFGAPFGREIRTGNLTQGSDGIRLKDEGVYQMMNEYLSGGTATRRTGQQALAAEDKSLENLRTKYNAADALYREMQVQSKSRPGLAATLPEYQKKRDALEKALNLAIASANSNETLMPSRDRPTAEPIRGSTSSLDITKNPTYKWLSDLGTDYTSPEGKKALQARVDESKKGGKKLTEVEMLRAKQAGLL